MHQQPKKVLTRPDIAVIVGKFLGNEESGILKFINWYNLWSAVREEPGQFRYAVWIKSAFLTSVIVLIYTCIRTVSILADISNLYEENRARFNSNLNELNTFLTNAGWTDGIDSVARTVVVELYFVVDAVVLDLKNTAWVGYTLGLLVGLYSLVAVLIQHKRVSLAVTAGLNAYRREAAAHNQETENPWPAFQKKYPILGACFFLAILSSTAVVQLHIVGVTVAVLLGLVVNVAKLSILMDIFGFYILAYVLVFFIDLLVMHFLKTWLVSFDGARIKHPRWFNFFIVVFSMVMLLSQVLSFQ